MKKFLMILAITAMMAVILTCSAFAAAGVNTERYTTAKEDATVTYNATAKNYTVKYSGSDLVEGNSYILLVVRGTESNYVINENNILYINQVDNCDGDSVAFENFEPMEYADAVVLLGGEFEGATSPKILGEVFFRGVKVSASIKAYNADVAPVATLYATTDTAHTAPLFTATLGTAEKSGTQYVWSCDFEGVSEGSYDLVVTKTGNLAYTVKGIAVGAADLDLTTNAAAGISMISMIAGEFTGDTRINTSDFNKFRTNYTKTGTAIIDPATDITGDGRVNTSDYTAFRSGYTKTATACTFTYTQG